MNLFDLTKALNLSSKRLTTIRNSLYEISQWERNCDERYAIQFCVFEMDIVYSSIIREYELLDTSNIIDQGYLGYYFSRRIETLTTSRMTIDICREGLEDMAEVIKDRLTLSKINRAKSTVDWSLSIIDQCLTVLYEHTTWESTLYTIH
jgi:hypothetical protein